MNNTTTKYNTSRARKYELDLSRYYRLPAVQSSLSVVLSLFVVAFFLVFALRPTFISIVELQKNIEESKKTLTQLEAKVQTLESVSKRWEELKKYLPMIDASIPQTGASYQEFVSVIELLASQAGVKLDTGSLGNTLLFSRVLSPFTQTKSSDIVEMPFALRVVGTYAQVSDFLALVMKLDRLMALDTLTYSREGVKGAQPSDTPLTTLTIQGRLFYLADLKQLKKAIETTEKKGGR